MRTSLISAIVSDLCRADRLERQGPAILGAYDRYQAALIRADCSRHRVLADWLEETGEERLAELVRIGCELAQIDCDKPNGCDGCLPHSEALRRREQELRKELNPFVESVEVEWDRGLIVGVTGYADMNHNSGPAYDTSKHGRILDRNSPYHVWPIRTIALRNWYGIERSLPREPGALPWLRCLRLPIARPAPWETDRWVSDLFGSHPDYPDEPRVRVEFVEAHLRHQQLMEPA